MSYRKLIEINKGFTLVELMVVVAIIGILSAIAIPNFKTYQAKAKTSEAKIQLASIYQAEIAIQSDFDAFGTCLTDAGYIAPKGDNYYALGYPAANTTANTIIRSNGGTCNDPGTFGFPAMKKVAGVAMGVNDLANVNPTAGSFTNGFPSPQVANTGAQFLAGAIGTVSSDTGKTTNGQNDTWAIDENKTLRHVRTGY
jgi:type IV pilus assembly protein PilA